MRTLLNDRGYPHTHMWNTLHHAYNKFNVRNDTVNRNHTPSNTSREHWENVKMAMNVFDQLQAGDYSLLTNAPPTCTTGWR